MTKLTTRTGDDFKIYLTGPEDADRAVMLIHDWWGMKEYNRQWADRFAELGYRVMVVDLYDGYHPSDVQEAGQFMKDIDQEEANNKMAAALNHLKAKGRKVAVLGWSFGGLQAQYATYLDPAAIAATVIYYCRLLTDMEDIETLEGPVLAIFAESERTWPAKQEKLEALMQEAGKVLECKSYPADHGFVNPESSRYNAEASEDSWQVTIDFLNRHLGG